MRHNNILDWPQNTEIPFSWRNVPQTFLQGTAFSSPYLEPSSPISSMITPEMYKFASGQNNFLNWQICTHRQSNIMKP